MPGFEVSNQTRKDMARFNVTYRVTARAGHVQHEPVTDANGDPVLEKGTSKPRMRVVRDEHNRPVIGPGTIVAEIIDLDTGQAYLDAEGASPLDAVEAAMRMVPITPKPKTRGQQLVEQGAAAGSVARQGEIDDLKAQVAALEARLAGNASQEPAPAAPATDPTPAPVAEEPTTPDDRAATRPVRRVGMRAQRDAE